MKNNPKSQTFRCGKYHIDLIESPILGMCEKPSKDMYLMIPSGGTQKDLAVIIHEAGHAEGIPDKYLDGERDSAEHIAKLLWRLGWRKK